LFHSDFAVCSARLNDRICRESRSQTHSPASNRSHRKWFRCQLRRSTPADMSWFRRKRKEWVPSSHPCRSGNRPSRKPLLYYRRLPLRRRCQIFRFEESVVALASLPLRQPPCPLLSRRPRERARAVPLEERRHHNSAIVRPRQRWICIYRFAIGPSLAKRIRNMSAQDRRRRVQSTTEEGGRRPVRAIPSIFAACSI